MGVPMRSSSGSYSHMARPHPWDLPTEAMVDTSPRYSG